MYTHEELEKRFHSLTLAEKANNLFPWLYINDHPLSLALYRHRNYLIYLASVMCEDERNIRMFAPPGTRIRFTDKSHPSFGQEVTIATTHVRDSSAWHTSLEGGEEDRFCGGFEIIPPSKLTPEEAFVLYGAESFEHDAFSAFCRKVKREEEDSQVPVFMLGDTPLWFSQYSALGPPKPIPENPEDEDEDDLDYDGSPVVFVELCPQCAQRLARSFPQLEEYRIEADLPSHYLCACPGCRAHSTLQYCIPVDQGKISTASRRFMMGKDD